MPTLLIVEDDKPIRDMFRFAILKTDFVLLEAENGRALWEKLDIHQADLILMDWMLPDASGIELTKQLKNDDLTADIPIIMLTARIEERDKVEGLNAGADDYVVKPFSPLELIARIKAVLRRSQKDNKKNELICDELIMDLANHQVMAKNDPIELGSKEYLLLKYFMENANQVLSRSQIMDRIWGRNTYVEDRTVDVHIGRLRKALASAGYSHLVQTVRGAGYRFSEKKR